MNALIFGANGQDGYFLTDLLHEKNIETVNVSRHSGDTVGSISDFNFVENLIKKEQPEYIFHLAANSTTRHDALFENHTSQTSECKLL